MSDINFFNAAKSGDLERIHAYIASGKDINTEDTTERFEGFTALHWAIQYGQVEAVKLLLEKGANPARYCADNTSALCRAVYSYCFSKKESRNDSREIISLLTNALLAYDDPVLLLEALNKENNDGLTPRFLAQYHDKIPELTLLDNAILEAKARIKSHNESVPVAEARQQMFASRDLFMAAKRRSNKDMVKSIKAGADPSLYHDAYGWNVLHHVLCMAHTDFMLDLLLYAGADPDTRVEFINQPIAPKNITAWKAISSESFNRSALFLAIHRQQEYAFSRILPALQEKYIHNTPALIRALSDRESNGNTPLDEAKATGNKNLINTLQTALEDAYQKLEKENKLFAAIERKDNETIVSLLRAGDIPAECCNIEGETALSMLLNSGNAVIIDAVGQNIIQTYEHNAGKALEVLKKTEHLATSESGRRCWNTQTKKAAQQHEAQTQLINAVSGNSAFVERYLESGQPLPILNGENMLFLAASIGSLDITKMLIARGERADSADKSKKLALTVAMENGHYDIADVLMDAILQDSRYENPAEFLRLLKQEDCVTLTSPATLLSKDGIDPAFAQKIQKLISRAERFTINIETDTSSLADVLHANATKLQAKGNNVFYTLQDKAILKEVKDALEDIGIRKLPYSINIGSHSIVFKVSDVVIRLSKKSAEEGKRINTPEILQPIYNADIGHEMGLEILPAVRTQDVDMEDCQALAIALAKKGFYFYDIKPANIGKLPCGTPVVIDAGSVVTWDELNRMGSVNSNIATIAQQAFQAFGEKPIPDIFEHFAALRAMPQPEYDWENAQAAILADKDSIMRRNFISAEEVNAVQDAVIKSIIRTGATRTDINRLTFKTMIDAAKADRMRNNGEPPSFLESFRRAATANEGISLRDVLSEQDLDWAAKVLETNRRKQLVRR